MEVEVITEFNEFLKLERVWNELLMKSNNNIIFFTHEWFHCWWLGYGNDKRLYILLVKDNDMVVGIVPLFLKNDRYRSLPVKKLSFLENGITPRLDFIADVNKKREVINCFIDYLMKNKELWHVTVLRKIEFASELNQILQKSLEERNILFGIKESLKTPFLFFDADWESYYASRSMKFRKVMRNKLNRVHRSGEVVVERVYDEHTLLKMLPKLFDISSRSWKAKKGASLKSNKEQLVFYRELTSMGGEKGWVTVWLLKINGEYVAFEYHLQYEGVVFPIRADYDERYKKLSPGSILEYNILKTYFEESKIRKYDFCGTSYDYMLNWTKNVKSHVNYEIFSPRILSELVGFTEYKIVPPLKKIRDLIRS